MRLLKLSPAGVVINVAAAPDEGERPAHLVDWIEDPTGRTAMGWVTADGGLTFTEAAPVADLAVARAKMVCSRLQGRLVLGEATCTALDAMAVDPNTPWAMRQTILHAIEWRRLSQAMTELGYLLGYTDDQMDALFLQAMEVEV